MNTPSHVIINLAIFSKLPLPQANLAIAIGAVLPDLPMFGFYIWLKYVRKMPSREIWSKAYFEPFWQNIFDVVNSIPLIVIGLAIAYYYNWQIAQVVFVSMLVHCLFDLPVHNDDAHRHFLPFSNYRFISPVSYWDPRHHGAIVALLELILVLLATLQVFPAINSWLGKGLMLASNAFYIVGYLKFYVVSSMVRSLRKQEKKLS